MQTLNNAWPLLNSSIASLTIIQLLTLLLWLSIGLLSIAGFLITIRWWINNGILFKPKKWNVTWFSFGIIRWIFILGLFYLFFIWGADFKNANSLFDESPWFGFLFLLSSIGVYERLTYIRLWWELKKLSPDMQKKIESDFREFGINFDPLAYKLGLLSDKKWS
jgi:hypothetical protein